MSNLKRIRIFLSSPADVAAERKEIRAIIETELAKERLFRVSAKLEVVSWDDPQAPIPLDARLTPQEALNRGLPLPADCDVVVVVLWSRMGTPLPATFRKPNGEPYLSGTEWEYLNAATAKKPRLLVYRCTNAVTEAWRTSTFSESGSQREEQYSLVQSFFSRFTANDGSLRGSYKRYETLKEFRELVKLELREVLQDLLLPGPYGRADLGIARTFQTRVKAFRDEYLISETGRVPFGGRDQELQQLDRWLLDENASPRMLLTSPAGRGKSGLLVDWVRSLQELGVLSSNQWEVAFMPISIRIGTNRPAIFYDGLARRLAEITGEPLPSDSNYDTEVLKYAVRDQLDRISTGTQRVLAIVDGIDEALQGSFDSSIIPPKLSPMLRILLSARWLVGDINSDGWLRRLGWDRNVRVDTFELPPLDARDISDVLCKLGAPVDALSRNEHIVTRVAELTEGEPILVRYYCEDLWQRSQSDVQITSADLDSMKPGFHSYFQRWMDHQKQLWKHEGMHIDENQIDAVLSILSFAQGPLEAAEFAGLMETIHQDSRLHADQTVLEPLRRFVIGNGKPGHGYVLSHSKIGEYLRGLFRAHSTKVRAGFAKWGLEQLRALNSRRLSSNDASQYAMQFLHKHLAESNTSITEWMELVEDGRRLAWETFEGSPRGFCSDVQAVWEAVRTSGVLTIGQQWRCALVLSSIKSLGSNIPGPLLVAAVQKEQLSIRQAAYLAELSSNEIEIVNTLVSLTRLDTCTPAQQTDLIASALVRAERVRDDSSRVDALLLLVPYLTPEQQPQVITKAFAAARAIRYDWKRVWSLSSLAPHLSAAQLSEVIELAASLDHGSNRANILCSVAPHLSPAQDNDALAIARCIKDDESRARALASLARTFSGETREKLMNEALLITREIVDPFARGRALSELVPSLSAEQRQEVISEALGAVNSADVLWIEFQVLGTLASYLSVDQKRKALANVKAASNREMAAELLVGLAPYLTCEQRTEALEIARAIPQEETRANTLSSLVPHLLTAQLNEILVAASLITDERHRAQVLKALAKHVSKDQLESAFQATKAIVNGEARAVALGSLASRLSKEQIGEALAAAKAISDKGAHASALGALALHMSAKQRIKALSEALRAANSINEELFRGIALGWLVQHLCREQIGEVLVAALAFRNEFARLQVMSPLAPRLSAEHLDRALAAAEALTDDSYAFLLTSLVRYLTTDQVQRVFARARILANEESRARLLESLASRLPTEQRVDALTEALASTRAIQEPRSRTSLLRILALNLPKEERDKVLGEALATAAIIDERDDSRAMMLEALAPHLSLDQRSDAIAIASTISRPRNRLRAMGELARSTEQIADVLTAINAANDEWDRAHGLDALSQYLSGSQIDMALDTARAIRDEHARAHALGSLAPHVGSGHRAIVINEAITAANLITKKETDARAHALRHLALNLPVECRDGPLSLALGAVVASESEWTRALMMGSLAPYLTRVQLTEALEATRALADGSACANALGALAPHLSEKQRDDALVAAMAIGDAAARLAALCALASDAKETQHKDIIEAMLEAAIRCHRPEVLHGLRASAHILATFESKDMLDYIHDACSDVVRWYP